MYEKLITDLGSRTKGRQYVISGKLVDIKSKYNGQPKISANKIKMYCYILSIRPEGYRDDIRIDAVFTDANYNILAKLNLGKELTFIAEPWGDFIQNSDYFNPCMEFYIDGKLINKPKKKVSKKKDPTEKDLYKKRIKSLLGYETRKNLTVDGIYEILEEQDFKCAYTGKKLNILPGKFDSLSIDQKISGFNGGKYEDGNIQLICFGINKMKSTMNDTDFRKLCTEMVDNWKN